MITFSCCMIVKNEEKLLARCLDSIKDLMDEIIIVDTGSTDSTKEIARNYTDKIYDFKWIDDFSAARNFSFEKATMDYIYCPDADEYLDEANHKQLSYLKQVLDPQVDIVQMMYHTISLNTVLNIENEYRPKLFKRLRTFTWVDPVHETVRLEPLVFDSDIMITHAPLTDHSKRDFGIFEKEIREKGQLSKKIATMYATELIKKGDLSDLLKSKDYFQKMFETASDNFEKMQAACILMRIARLKDDAEAIQRILPEYPATGTTSEICYDLGIFYMNQFEYEKAIDWLHIAINDVSYIIDVHTGGDFALKALIDCYQNLIDEKPSSEKMSIYTSELSTYKKMLSQWRPPEEHK